jgi:hypothetical protein
MSDIQKVTYLGKIDFRNKELTFGIKERDRTKHMYVIGKSGMGKSTLLENLVIQDINNGEGVCVLDPHGELAEKLLDHIPESRVKDVVYFAPFDGEYPIGFNMLEKVAADKRFLVANGLMSAFKKMFTDADGKGTFSARMEYVLNNIILALLENEGQTLLGVNRMLFDKEYRKFIVSNVTDLTVRDFWTKEYANYTEKTMQELAPAIQNKIGQLVANPLIRNIIGQQKTSFDIRKLMDEKKIFIANLSKGKNGEGNAKLLGSLLVTKIYLAAMSRADMGPYEAEKLPPFYFYVDEFQNFANESFAGILSEARKYKLALTVAHQYIEQMTDDVRAAVFGNVGTMITFRIGATDAEIFEKEFAPYFVLDDFVNLSAHQIYLRLMIDNVGSKPFSAHTLPPIEKPAHSFEQAVIAHSRATYAKPRFVVEDEIALFYEPIAKEQAGKVEKKKEFDGGGQQPKFTQKEFNQPKQFSERGQGGDQREKREQGGQREERQLHIRKITDQTPLPPRRIEPKKDGGDKPVTKEDIYFESRAIEEEFHKPPQGTTSQPSYEDRRPKKETPLKAMSVPTFDDKPALSLKDALAKAMSEHEGEKKREEKKILEVKEESTRKEVSEEVLRKLLED